MLKFALGGALGFVAGVYAISKAVELTYYREGGLHNLEEAFRSDSKYNVDINFTPDMEDLSDEVSKVISMDDYRRRKRGFVLDDED